MLAVWVAAAAVFLIAALAIPWLCATGGWRRIEKFAGAGQQPPHVPPVVPGLPLLGSALALGVGGAAFLQQCREQYGDAFTLRLLGQRMTFLFAPAAVRHYFTAPDSQLTFAPAVQQFTHRVFGLPPQHFYSRHMTMLQTLRHQLVPSALPQHTARLLRLLLARLARWPASGQLELVGAIKTLVFEASVGALFGERFLAESDNTSSESGGGSTWGSNGLADGSNGASATPTPASAAGPGAAAPTTAAAASSSARAQRLQLAFFEFEEGFELAASPLPHLFQPRFLAARRRLLAALRESYLAGHFEGTVAGELIQACGLPQRYVPNMLLAVLWASQANAVPTTFWALGFLLLPDNRSHREAVEKEALAVLKEAEAAMAVAVAVAAAGRAGAGAEAASSGLGHAAAGHGLGQGVGAHAASVAAGPSSGSFVGPSTVAQEAEDRRPQLLSATQQQGLVALATNRHSQVAAAVAEAMRLRSFSIDVRIAAADSVLSCGDGSQAGGDAGVWVKKGDVVAISPYSSHLDPRLYRQAPSAFNPGREGMHLGGSSAPHAVVVGVGGVPGLSFGGGKYRCPGRYFAEAELALMTSLLLLLFDWQLLPRDRLPEAAGGSLAGAPANQRKQAQRAVEAAGAPGDPAGLLPPPNLRKLVGIKVPDGPCWAQYTRRQLA